MIIRFFPYGIVYLFVIVLATILGDLQHASCLGYDCPDTPQWQRQLTLLLLHLQHPNLSNLGELGYRLLLLSAPGAAALLVYSKWSGTELTPQSHPTPTGTGPEELRSAQGICCMLLLGTIFTVLCVAGILYLFIVH